MIQIKTLSKHQISFCCSRRKACFGEQLEEEEKHWNPNPHFRKGAWVQYPPFFVETMFISGVLSITKEIALLHS
jgi:hypothetical protein